VGASTTIGSYLVPDLFARFKREHPALQLELEIANTAAIQAAVREDRLDLGLTEGLVEGEQLLVEVVAHDEMVMIAAPTDPISKRGPLQVRELPGLPILMREHGSGTRDVIEAALAEQGVRLEPLMSLGSSEALKTAVQRGLGMALLSRLTVELELKIGSLCVVEIADLNIRRALHLLTLEGKTPSPAAFEFIALLRQNSTLPH
jgi:DNA-binding transcriptional LysR family regulator